MNTNATNDEIIEYLEAAISLETKICETSRAIGHFRERINGLETKYYPEFQSKIRLTKTDKEKAEEENRGCMASLALAVLCFIVGAFVSNGVLNPDDSKNVLSFLILDFLGFLLMLSIAAVCGFLGAFLPLIFSSIYESRERRKIKAKEEEPRRKHGEKIALMKQYDQDEIEYLESAIRALEDNKIKLLKLLASLYSDGPIAPEYQSLAAECHILQYFNSRQKPVLDKALDSYDEERRNQKIIEKLDVVIQKLDEIIENQGMLYRLMTQMNDKLDDIDDSLSRCEAQLDRTALASELNAYLKAKRLDLLEDYGYRYLPMQDRYDLVQPSTYSIKDPAIKAILRRYDPLTTMSANNPNTNFYLHS